MVDKLGRDTGEVIAQRRPVHPGSAAVLANNTDPRDPTLYLVGGDPTAGGAGRPVPTVGRRADSGGVAARRADSERFGGPDAAWHAPGGTVQVESDGRLLGSVDGGPATRPGHGAKRLLTQDGVTYPGGTSMQSASPPRRRAGPWSCGSTSTVWPRARRVGSTRRIIPGRSSGSSGLALAAPEPAPSWSIDVVNAVSALAIETAGLVKVFGKGVFGHDVVREADAVRRRVTSQVGSHPSTRRLGGMRRRLDIAASILITPDLLFLDEPTAGLDPRSRNQVWDIVRALVPRAPRSCSPPSTSTRRTSSPTVSR